MKRTSLNLNWTRALGSGWRKDPPVPVNLPDDYISTLHRTPDNPGAGSVGYFASQDAEYRKNLDIPSDFDGTLFLYLDGVYEKAEICIDQNLVFYHPYGYTPALVDLSEWVAPGEHELRISTSCRHPASRWYTGGGIYREVFLYSGGKVFIRPTETFVSTPVVSVDKALVHIETVIENRDSEMGARLCAAVSSPEGEQAGSIERELLLMPGDNKTVLEIAVEKPVLWDLSNPKLYKLELKLLAEDAEDSEEITFGIRRIEIDAAEGFRLNGKLMKLRGGCIHHDNAFLGSAAFPRAEERKIEKLKEAGFNAIRTAHNPPSSALLSACDRLGMLVLTESFDCWRVGKTPMDYHREFEKWWEYDTAAMVKQARNHPSVFCYSIGNEIMEFDGASNGVYWGKVQADFVRALDPTRPVTSGINMACGRPADHFTGMNYQQMAYEMAHSTGIYDGVDRWDEATKGNIANLDIAGYNYMYSRYDQDREKYPERVIMGTETMPFYLYENTQAVDRNPNVIGDFVWVAMDYMGEAGMGNVFWGKEPPSLFGFEGFPWLSCLQGDLDLTGHRRPINYYRNIVWGQDSGVHLFVRHPRHAHEAFYGNGWHWEEVLPNWTYEGEWIGQDIAVVAYADCDLVKFYVNGTEKAEAVPEHFMARAVIPYEPGVIEAVSYRAGAEFSRDRIESAGTPATIRLIADRTEIEANGMDLSFIRAEITDNEGRMIYGQDFSVSVTVSGVGTLAGLGSGNPKTPEDYGTGSRNSFHGSVTAAVRAGKEQGTINVCFQAPGLPEAVCSIRTK
ncbi:MAG: DUF4982 domain-containing protein [Lachnospiraceae bacterium]|nr:DUF4982 domain-containing protein [Lachnospiraceae bacterium]